LLDQFPLALVSSAIATLVVMTFFVTSSDSGSLVIDIITAGGRTDPPTAQRVFWAVTEGAVAATLLVAGGLDALQTASITTALPFACVLLVACVGLVKGLRAERLGARPSQHLAPGVSRQPDMSPSASSAEPSSSRPEEPKTA
jgi:choline/glycine/proline betaine transport protein